MEILIFLICAVFVVYYLFRPTSKKEKDQFDDFSDNDRWLMMSEGRRWNMTWQIVSPKNI